MTPTGLAFGSPQWVLPAALTGGVAVVLVVWGYARSRGPRRVAVACAGLKTLAVAGLALCLVEPMLTGARSQPGANVFVVLVDTSRSLSTRPDAGGPSRADWVRGLVENRPAWRTRLGQDFDVRPFAFDTHLRGVDGFDGLAFDVNATSLHAALAAVAKRFQGRPLAGVLLVSDGNATDAADLDWGSLPPVYPVLPPAGGSPRDVAVTRVTASQTNFEAAPVTLQAEATAHGFAGRTVVAVLANEGGRELDRQEAKLAGVREPLSFRFQVRPEKAGVGFYRVTVRLTDERGDDTREQTLANNSRLVAVDRGRGPHRVLYVAGRPNWEFKYLRRALDEDAEVQLVGLVRVARREPKFDFRAPRTRPDNPLFKGFDNPDAETAERHDQPVLIRLGTQDAAELRTGFPQAAADLFRYDAVILDDLEADFFTPDQQALLRAFVGRRGGGFLMLGGPDTFAAGKYDRTPVGELLPVYLDRPPGGAGGDYKLSLTREGWLQPWVRTRKTEDDETRRLAGMAPFQTVSRVGRAKPGASVLAQVKDAAGNELPALVAQPFGKGRSAALLVGDVWRWGLRRDDPKADDFDRAWRQTVRWLVADVPGRVEVRATPTAGTARPGVELAVQAADAEYVPLDNATVSVQVTPPNGEPITLPAEADRRAAGQYAATFVPRDAGAYRATATVTAPDGSSVGRREVGWCVQPDADEFARLDPNRELLEQIAARTKGEVVPADGLDGFVANLPSRQAPHMEAWAAPLWHRGWYFAVTIACLAAEWGLRRRYGMA